MWYRDRMQAKEHRDPTSCMTLSRYLTWPGLRAFFCELVTTAEAAGSPSLSAQPISEADFRQLPTNYLHAGLCQQVFPRWECSLLWDCRKCWRVTRAVRSKLHPCLSAALQSLGGSLQDGAPASHTFTCFLPSTPLPGHQESPPK